MKRSNNTESKTDEYTGREDKKEAYSESLAHQRIDEVDEDDNENNTRLSDMVVEEHIDVDNAYVDN